MINAASLTTRELIAADGAVVAELTARGLRRTSGPLIGELAERLALDVYGGARAATGGTDMTERFRDAYEALR